MLVLAARPFLEDAFQIARDNADGGPIHVEASDNVFAQFICYDDGSLVAECVSNDFLGADEQLTVDDEARLLPMLFRTHDCALDRAPHRGFERVPFDARQELGEERLVHPVDALTLPAGRSDEVEEVDDRCRRLSRVDDERMTFAEPAHRDLPALALDLLRLDRATLLGDVEERFKEQSPL